MIRKLAPVLAVCALALSTLPAVAQWVAVGRWGEAGNFRYVAPGTWMVQRQGDGVEISAEGDNHVGRLALWCTPAMPGGGLTFDNYNATGLRLAPDDAAELSGEVVTLIIDAQHFEATFVHIPWERMWAAENVMSPALMNAFAYGSRLELRNAAGEVITGYALTGSSAAREAVRRACRI